MMRAPAVPTQAPVPVRLLADLEFVWGPRIRVSR